MFEGDWVGYFAVSLVLPCLFCFAGNLLLNNNLSPKIGWNGDTTDEVRFNDWKVLENGGHGVKLERIAQGINFILF